MANKSELSDKGFKGTMIKNATMAVMMMLETKEKIQSLGKETEVIKKNQTENLELEKLQQLKCKVQWMGSPAEQRHRGKKEKIGRGNDKNYPI